MPPASPLSAPPAPQTIPHLSLLSIILQSTPVLAISPVSTSHYSPNTAYVFFTSLPPECPQPPLHDSGNGQSICALASGTFPQPGQLAHISSSAPTQKLYCLLSHPWFYSGPSLLSLEQSKFWLNLVLSDIPSHLLNWLEGIWTFQKLWEKRNSSWATQSQNTMVLFC